MKLQSVMNRSFAGVPAPNIERSVFNRDHGYKTTFDAGYLVPFFVDEALPGDSFTVNLTGFARLNTPIFPIMDNMIMETHFFSVPERLVWTNWKRFMGERDPDPDSSIDYVMPTMTSTAVTGYANESLHDYLGIPTKIPDLEHRSDFHRAYNLIWNTWFRDQNLQDSVVVDLDDGPDDPADYVLLRRGKRHDYFTSCLTAPQKGDPVSIPIGTVAPVVTTGANIYLYNDVDATDRIVRTEVGTNNVGMTTGPSGTGLARFGTSGTGLQTDLSSATAATINQLRQAFQIQRLLEKDARGGTRYAEQIKAHFGVIDPQYAVLQMPEYLGGGSSPVVVSPVAQTSSTDVTSPQGNLAGVGRATLLGHGFSKSFTEHCIVIGLVSVRADITYQQGLPRMFSRSTRYDFAYPSLMHLGEQAVLNKEIYAQGSLAATDDNVFGYQERYAEYRYKNSQVTGKFRSNDAATLDAWHLSPDFGALPVLNASFIEENPPVDRVVAVPAEPDFIFDSFISFRAARPMPVYSVPGLIDHF